MALFGPSKLTRQMDASMGRIQALGIAPQMQQAYQQAQSLGNVGMDAASQQLAMQEQARGMNTALRALGSRRSALAGISGITAGANDFALRLAAQNAAMKREGKMAGIQAGMQLGQTQMELDKSKAEADYNALAAKKQARQAMTNTIISTVGQLAAAAIGKKG
jgi:hypothetical protein